MVRIIPIGAFVELFPGKDGMIHISKLAPQRIEKVEDAVSVGDELTVRVAAIDNQGRVNLVRTDIEVPDRPRNPLPPRRDFHREGGEGHRPPRGPRNDR